jgi:pimeloyl-ACP methyl ester carboxylesterase
MGTRIVLLPGLGADARLFVPQLEAFPDAVVPDWTLPQHGETLGSFSARFAEEAIHPSPGENWVIAGFSFGSQVALEIASRLPEDRRPRAVGLISGLRSRQSITRAFRWQVRVGTSLPGFLAKAVIAGPLAGIFARACGLDEQQTAALHAMAEDADWDLLVRAARAASAWDFGGECPVPVAWIHGERDRIVPYRAHPAFNDAVELLDDGSHLLTWTQAERVNAWLERLAQRAPAAGPGEG